MSGWLMDHHDGLEAFTASELHWSPSEQLEPAQAAILAY